MTRETIPFQAADYAHDGKKHLLLAATGSVATIKIPCMLHRLSRHGNLSVRLLLTASARKFLHGQAADQPPVDLLAEIANVDGIYTDIDEWIQPWTRTRPILHIELRRWADLMVIAPLSANSLAKMSMGIADSLLLSVVRAWDTTGTIDDKGRRKIIVAPAMNTAMWIHPITVNQMRILENEWSPWIDVLVPVEKVLACGDAGIGAMRDWESIVEVIEQGLHLGVQAGQVEHERPNDAYEN